MSRLFRSASWRNGPKTSEVVLVSEIMTPPPNTTNIVRSIGWLMLIGGVGLAVFGRQVVFPGLEHLLGIETIVGRDNVVSLPDGGYAYTNPGAMVRWIAGVATVGVVTGASGLWLLWKTRRP